MTRNVLLFATYGFLVGMAPVVHAQTAISKNEVGLVIGATVSPSVGLQRGGSIEFDPALSLGAEYDRHVFGRRAAVYGGVDFLLSPSDLKVSNPAPDVSPQSAYLFLTPHVRVKFNPEGAFQPWLLFGGGYANFAPSEPRASLVDVTGHGGTNTFVFGGGVDSKPLVHFKFPVVGELPIGARVEVRDFYSGQPDYGLPVTSSRQNFVAFTGGLVLHF